MHVLSIFGTRPEAIKMAPLVIALRNEPHLRSSVCVTGQHREMLAQVMQLFDLHTDHALDVMRPDQTLNGLYARLIASVDEVLATVRPDCVLVHGDTTTATACAMAAFHRRIPVGHVEAGLRSGDLQSPFPEEMNRRFVDAVATWLFAPTVTARDALQAERLPGRIWVTGNTVIDALATTVARLAADAGLARTLAQRHGWLDPRRKLVLVTGHRRENFGEGFRGICAALRTLAGRSDVQIVYPVHLNPQVHDVVRATLSDLDNVHLIAPLDYLDFVWFMQRAHLILTDSGGVQEEAPHLGKPVLVMRDVTERPEAVAAGTVRLVGTSPERILTEAARLLDDDAVHAAFGDRGNPYGDGHACGRIVDALCGRPVAELAATPTPNRVRFS
ncbi:non-hydrolyzing UDP-N-acetylglucosamine 2-epimerase [Variovorax ginsengisoli]|uniref:UDP-N-acetylglucosamine 2-epimerase (non-hydrolyzing) n=1 Tax=Variovorax ginsengisoli TaxID=363844 RepID=A0ABT9S8G4_9BURK|nr:UDP-N-acetylglucosamine 2-epimerase (non-hydrolyzing) [Variovorax ginsengisoli]MDP9900644.1 UDP-N-acetylglucosamine 2-epimerase (non-hydrolyzing) [Variovorax ginsengisoli]